MTSVVATFAAKRAVKFNSQEVGQKCDQVTYYNQGSDEESDVSQPFSHTRLELFGMNG
jgi:uncharacterized protein (DUF2164 family)